MSEAPRYRDGHAVVAAVRVHEVKEGRPPTSEEVAALLGWHPDLASVVTRSLVDLGVLRPFQSPYDVRYEVRDHLALEKLEDDDTGSGFAQELDEFAARTQSEHDRLAQILESGETDRARQERVESLDQAFKAFRKDKPSDPFGKS